MRSRIKKSVGVFALTQIFSLCTAQESNRPNIVLILADDLGYGDLGCYGATKIKTPNIDKVATEGRRFIDAHSSSAVCTPSRYGLLTGEYPGRKGIWGPCGHTQSLLIDPSKETIASLLKKKEYATACLGKWHLGFGKGKTDWSKPLRPGPLDVGFDYYFGVPKVNSGFPYVYVENDMIVGYDPNDPLVFGQKPYSKTKTYPEAAGKKTVNLFGGAKKAHAIYDEEHTAELLVEKGKTWIGEHKDNPFFLYMATTNIHHPFTPGPRFKGSSQCGLYGDFVQELDWMVGEIVKSLEENGVADNTLLIVTSDNGGMFNRGGQDAFKDGHRQNGDLLGFKFGVWEGGQRIPFIAKWPGKIQPNTVSDQLISGVDMLATFAAIVDQDIEPNQLADSVNILPALIDNPTESLRDKLVLFPRFASNVAIRKGKWLYIGAQGAGGFKGKPGAHGAGGAVCAAFIGNVNSDFDERGNYRKSAPKTQLYDLSTDLSQTKNVVNDYPEVAKEMQALLVEAKKGEKSEPKSAGRGGKKRRGKRK